MSRFRAEENADLVREIQALISEFMIKLYEYTYGKEWYLLKGETDLPETYDVQHLIKFLAYDTLVKGGERYPEAWNIFRNKYRDIIGNPKKYRLLLGDCLKIRNTVTGHQSALNMNRASGMDSFLHYAETFLGILRPFKNISELNSENNLSYYAELEYILKSYVVEDRFSLDTIRMDIGDELGFVSDTDILDICANKNYGIYGDAVSSSDYERLLSDIRSEFSRRKHIKQKSKINRGVRPFVVVILVIIIAILSVPSYLYIKGEFFEPSNCVNYSLPDEAKEGKIHAYVSSAIYDNERIYCDITIANKSEDNFEDNINIEVRCFNYGFCVLTEKFVLNKIYVEKGQSEKIGTVIISKTDEELIDQLNDNGMTGLEFYVSIVE